MCDITIDIWKRSGLVRDFAENGADIIDIGGESTKPNARNVDEEEEARRILGIIKKLSKENFLISADTRKPNVMEKAIDNGAKIINDISGMSAPATPKIISKLSASIVTHKHCVARIGQAIGLCI